MFASLSSLLRKPPYETTDDGWKILNVFKGEMPEPIKRISAFAELSADNTEEGKERLKQALFLLQEVVSKEIGV